VFSLTAFCLVQLADDDADSQSALIAVVFLALNPGQIMATNANKMKVAVLAEFLIRHIYTASKYSATLFARQCETVRDSARQCETGRDSARRAETGRDGQIRAETGKVGQRRAETGRDSGKGEEA